MAERVTPVGIESEMRQSYLDYAMSVIVARALPDARDGLKPVQRRIIYAMGEMSLRHDTPYRKSARIVGEVLGKYHPHGEAAVYETMVRMAQDFSLRYPLVDGQGNFGSVDGDSAAAMRYTEARLAAISREMLQDIDKDTVDFSANFDESLQEPDVLPARLPNLLVNGSSGIAVGMSTNVPPHNLTEVCDALAYLLDRYDKAEDVDVEDVMRFIRGPDFPTGGILYSGGTEGADGDNPLRRAYATGRGQVRLRAKVMVEEGVRGGKRLVVTELPYQTNKARLIERIAELVRAERLTGVADLRDESDRDGMRLVVETTRSADPRQVLADLFRLTPMETTLSIILLALVDGEPRTCSLKRLLLEYIEHRLVVTRRRSEHDLARAREREHVLAGLLIALANIDEVIDTIRRSRTPETARANLIRRFRLTEVQAQAILDMQLRRLASLERKKLEEEHEQCLATIADLEELLADPAKMRALIKREVQELKSLYGDERRTQILPGAPDTEILTVTDLLPDREVLVLVDGQNRVAQQTLPQRLRIPRGVVLASLANLRDRIGFVTEGGSMLVTPVHRLPEGQPGDAPGLYSDNGAASRIVSLVRLTPADEGRALLLATAQGKVKRIDWTTTSVGWSPVLRLDDGDGVVAAVLAGDGETVVLASSAGQAIAFEADQVRVTGLSAGGVAGIRLGDGERVVAAAPLTGAQHLMVLSARGNLKRVTLRGWRSQNRGGAGIVLMATDEKTGEVAGAAPVGEGDRVLLVGSLGTAEVLVARSVPVMGRNTKGRALAKLKKRERAVAVMTLPEARRT
ncbi:MAG: DNA topoisomerase 4 subunit A [Anaerolineae bacterium]|nr:DNA topoisomerase 4 subunit A [Anaerolineae bacterium]